MGSLQRSEVSANHQRVHRYLSLTQFPCFCTEFRIAQSGMGWKGEESAATKSIPSTDIKWVQWLRVARNYRIRVAMKDGTRATFDGFSRDVSFLILLSSSPSGTDPYVGVALVAHPQTRSFQNHDKLVSLFKQHFTTQLESKEVSFRGWNWGSTDFQGSVGVHQPFGSSHTCSR